MPGAAPTPEGTLRVLDLVAVRRWAVLTRSLFAARRAEIDALNVFPVPDGDTGTNLYLTFDGAVERTLAEGATPGADALLATFARHLLWTARGNSGVILSQLARGLAEGCHGATEIDGTVLARGLDRARDRAREAVTDPKEGTILSVADAMAAAASSAGEVLHPVALAALESAREALARTPEQLEVLARAGVVDAGGAGLVVLLEALERVCAGQRAGSLRVGQDAVERRTRFRPDPQSAAASAALEAAHSHAPDTDGPAPEFEVMYLLSAADDESVAGLRRRLVELGDSVLVVGGDGEWNVHAHVDDAGAAVEAGIEAGRPHRVRITRLVDAHVGGHAVPAGIQPTAATGGVERAARAVALADAVEHVASGVVACAAGDGLEALFAEVGAVVVASGPGHRASTGRLIDAIRAQHARGASGVVVLPNDGDTLLAAAAAVRAVADEGIEAHVVHVRTAVQGIAAVAVFEPTAGASANVLAMQAAASATRHGAVTVATRAALTSGGPCEPGDVLGVVDGDVVIVGSDQLETTRDVVRRLLASGGELVTVVAGVDAPDGLLDAVTAEARSAHHGIEVTLIDGGQAIYTVLLGVE